MHIQMQAESANNISSERNLITVILGLASQAAAAWRHDLYQQDGNSSR